MEDALIHGTRWLPRQRRGLRAFRDWSLRTKTLLLLLVASSVPLVVAAWLGFEQARMTVTRDATARLSARAEELASRLDAAHLRYERMALALGGWPALRRALGHNEAGLGAVVETRELFAAFATTHPDIAWMVITDADGRVVVDSGKVLEHANVSSHPFFRSGRTARAGHASVSPLFLDPGIAGDTPLVAYSAAIAGPGGRFEGVIALFVRATTFWKTLQANNGRAGPESYALVMDHEGIRLAHSVSPDHLFRPTAPLSEASVAQMVADRRFGDRTAELLAGVVPAPEVHALATAEALDESGPIHRLRAEADGTWNLGVALRLHEVDWTVLTLVPEPSVYGRVSSLLLKTVGVGSALILLALAIGLKLSSLIQRPALALIGAAEAMARGELTTRVEVRSRDEIGRVCQRFNEMAEALVSAHAELEARVEERTRALLDANLELVAQRNALQEQQDELALKNREIARADRMKSEFLASMSHELRTPLNAIIGFAQLLGEELDLTLSSRHRKFLDDVLASARVLLALINDVLDLSKIEAGRVELTLQQVDPAALIGEATAMLMPVANGKGIRISQRVATGAAVRADAGKVRQILLNLLSNAVKFSAPGTTVEVAAEDVGPMVRFTVRDHGPGIDPALRPRLFEPFVQGASPLDKEHQGTGLGLAISRRLVEQHGGVLDYETRMGEGTTFRFALPCMLPASPATPASPAAVAAAAPPALPAQPATRAAELEVTAAMAPDDLVAATDPGTSANARIGPARVLVIDDDPAEGIRLRKLLGPGFEVELERAGATGLAAALDRPPDAVIVDFRLPDLSGPEVIARLRADHRTAPCPLLVLSAYDISPAERQALGTRVEVFATKSSQGRKELLAALERLTGRRPLRGTGQGERILVVDDNDMNRDLLGYILEQSGFEVHMAADGNEAIDLAHRLKPAIILMDLAMPGKDGYAATRELKNDAGTRPIPVVALSAMAMRQDEAKARAAGVDAYLTKPIDRAELEGMLASFLGKEPARASGPGAPA